MTFRNLRNLWCFEEAWDDKLHFEKVCQEKRKRLKDVCESAGSLSIIFQMHHVNESSSN